MPPPVFRFAPSPNGYLHLGHALSALLNAEAARAAGGRMLLRIEDIDGTRCRPEYEQAIYEDLTWLGVMWDEPVRRQSEHLGGYHGALARLHGMGLIYPSFESRAEIAAMVAQKEAALGSWPRDPDGAPLFPGDAMKLQPSIVSGAPYALRLNMAAALARFGDSFTWQETGVGPDDETGTIVAHPAAWGDIILARKETPNSYHLAVVVDDASQGVTNIVRGLDLFHATSVHRLLQALLSLPAPHYRHHRLILDAYGRKLSKSTSATGLRELRAQGLTPSDIRRMVGLD